MKGIRSCVLYEIRQAGGAGGYSSSAIFYLTQCNRDGKHALGILKETTGILAERDLCGLVKNTEIISAVI